MITRKIGSIVRGKATPFQIGAACVLGSMIGFAPGFAQAPGLIVALTLLLLVINANLLIAILVGVLAELISLAAMPVTFKVGQFFIDGPTQGLVKSAVNAPVLALFGFEYYVTTGGIVVGLAFGILSAVVLVGMISGVRKKMASVEEGSDLYKKMSAKTSVRLLTFIFLGKGHGKKKTWGDLAEMKRGNPIRVVGFVCAALVVGLLVIGHMMLSDQIVLAYLKDGLEKTNGATVDVSRASLDLKEGKMVVEGLAMADPKALETDLLRAVKLEADISASDLLRKRLTIDRIVVSDASTGEKRDRPGRIVEGAVPPPPPPPAEEGEKDLEDYLADAKVWKERLDQLREWLEKISSGAEDEPAEEVTDEESLRDWLEREIARVGYRRVAASHLIDDSPTLLVREFVAEKVKGAGVLKENETLNIKAENLSTHPRLVEKPPHVVITSSEGSLEAEVMVAQVAGGGEGGGKNKLTMKYTGLETNRFAGSMKVGDTQPIADGTIDVHLAGSWLSGKGGFIDLPLNVTLNDVMMTIPGVGSEKVAKLPLAIGLRGPISNPKITFDHDMFVKSLKDAGMGVLAGKLQSKVDEQVGGKVDELKGKLGDKLGGELGDKVKDSVGDGLKGALDIFGRKKKKDKDE